MQNNNLQRILGLGFGIAILVGGTIGVGILRTPGEIATQINSEWLIILCWLAGGAYVLLGCGAYAELATSIPKAGGSYNYIKRAFGDYAGFVSGWFDYITNATAPAFFCIVIGEYLAILFPVLEPAKTAMAIGFLIGFSALHAIGVKSGSIVQQLTSILKVVFFVALVVACFLYSGATVPNPAGSSHLATAGLALGFAKALQMVLGTYNGWYSVCFFAEEDQNPNRNIPRSLYTGALIVIAIYILINLAFMHVMSPLAMANSPLVAADVSQIVFGPVGSTIVTVISVFSIIGILNAYMMIPARILFGLGRDGFFIKSAVRVNKGGTPIVALLVSSVFSLGLIVIGSFGALFGLATFTGVIVWGMAYASLIRLRKTEPNLERPHKSWGHPYSTVLLLISTLAILVGFALSDYTSLAVVVLIGLASYPLFRLLKRRQMD